MKSFESIKHNSKVNFIIIFSSFLTEEVADNHCDWEQTHE